MIGNGIDIVYINRFEKIINNESTLKKIFTSREIEYIKSRSFNLNTIAGMYAAKEAFLKAFKKGINNYDLLDIEINHNSNNAPYFILYNKVLKDCLYKDISLSISHDKDYAIASVLVAF